MKIPELFKRLYGKPMTPENLDVVLLRLSKSCPDRVELVGKDSQGKNIYKIHAPALS